MPSRIVNRSPVRQRVRSWPNDRGEGVDVVFNPNPGSDRTELLLRPGRWAIVADTKAATSFWNGDDVRGEEGIVQGDIVARGLLRDGQHLVIGPGPTVQILNEVG